MTTPPITVSVAREFSITPGPRTAREGLHSGEEFLERLLLPRFDQAIAAGTTLVVELDGTAGYATSFLEAAFGGLARARGGAAVTKTLRLVASDEPYLLDEILGYIEDVAKAERRQ